MKGQNNIKFKRKCLKGRDFKLNSYLFSFIATFNGTRESFQQDNKIKIAGQKVSNVP